MKAKTLIPFLVILIVLIGIVAWQKMNVAPTVPIATRIGLESLVPVGLDKAGIARVEMFSGGKPEEKVILEREGDAWRISSLYNSPANKETVDGFIDKLIGLKGEPRANADTEERFAEFDLTDAKAFHVQAFKKDSQTPEMDVLFGKSPDFKTVFLRKAGGNRVFVEATNLRREAGVSDSGEDTVPKPAKWLKTALLELKDDTITQVALKYPDKDLVLTRKEIVAEPEPEEAAEGAAEEGESPKPPKEPKITYEWTVSQGGYSSPVNEQEVKTLLTRFANLAVTNVADPERKADWGFDPPLFSATISRAGEEDVVLLGGRDKPGGDTYIQRVGAQPELIYQISKFNFEQVFLQGSKLFTLPEWKTEKEAVRAIAVSGPDGNRSIAKAGDAWQVTEPQLTLETQKTALDNMVAAVASLKPADYADAGRDVGAFDTTVTVSLEGGATRTLHMGQPSKHLDGRYVKFDDAEAVFVLARADVEKLLPPVRDLFVLSVLDFDTEAVTQVQLTGEKGDLRLTRSEDSSQWSGTFNGAEIQPDPVKVDNLVFALNDFQVDNFRLDRTLDSVQAASSIKVVKKDGSETVIQISAESNGVYDVVISGIPYVFSATLLNLKGIVDEVAKFADLVPKAPEQQNPQESPDGAQDAVQPQVIMTPEATPQGETAAPPEAAADTPAEVVLDDVAVIPTPPQPVQAVSDSIKIEMPAPQPNNAAENSAAQ